MLVWDAVGEKSYEMGVSKGVLYPQDANGNYPKGVVWNGLINVTDSPGGAETTDLYADNIKYATMRSTETFGATIEAYMAPDEFDACDGSAEPAPGVKLGQQNRQAFGFSYRTEIGNDTQSESDDGYKLHLIYGATASPSEKSYGTISDSPEAINLSWEISSTPVAVPGYKSVSTITIDSRKADPDKLAALEAILYGKSTAAPQSSYGTSLFSEEDSDGDEEVTTPSSGTSDPDARLPMPEEILELFGATIVE